MAVRLSRSRAIPANRSPALWGHPLLQGCVFWYLAHPTYFHGKVWPDLLTQRIATLTPLAANKDSNGWGGTTRPGGLGEMRFDGTTNCTVTVPDADDLSFTKNGQDLPFSVCCWMWTDNVANLQGIIAKEGTFTANDEWYLAYNGANAILLECDLANGSQALVGATAITTTAWQRQWVHVAATYDGSEVFSGVKIYRNGVPQIVTGSTDAGYTGMTAGTSAVTFGHFTDGTGPFVGKLDDIRLYKRALSAKDVWGIYQQGLAGYPGIFPTRLLWNSGTVATTTVPASPAQIAWTAGALALRRTVLLTPAQQRWQVGTPVQTRTILILPARRAQQTSVMPLTQTLTILPGQQQAKALLVPGTQTLLVIPAQTQQRGVAPTLMRATGILPAQQGIQAQVVPLMTGTLAVTPAQMQQAAQALLITAQGNYLLPFQASGGPQTVTITAAMHQLGHADLTVTCYDTMGIWIKPASVMIDPVTFDVVVTFTQSQGGLIVLNGMAKTSPQLSIQPAQVRQVALAMPSVQQLVVTPARQIWRASQLSPLQRLTPVPAQVAWTPPVFRTTPGNYTKTFTASTAPQVVTVLGAEHTFQHADLTVTCYDTQGKWLQPGRITIHPTTYDVTVTFAQGQSGVIVLNGMKTATQGVVTISPAQVQRQAGIVSFQIPGNVTWTFTSATVVTIPGTAHDLGTADLVWQCYTTTGVPLLPQSVTIDPTTYDVTVTFLFAVSGVVALNGWTRQLSTTGTVVPARVVYATTPVGRRVQIQPAQTQWRTPVATGVTITMALSSS